ncbi:MAG: helix-turn-helix transcriptional regulator [Bdellovibrionales bacterium]|nr:helix-turn-helix transcriptional regulator [Bdellovibrionales bacterium]
MIEIHLDILLVQRKMKLSELSEKTGIQISNLSILKNNKAKAIRFSTLISICNALQCQPGDLMSFRDDSSA